MSLDVTLTYPRFRYNTYGGLEEPLGILYIGAVLRRAGHPTHVFDLTFTDDLSILDEAIERSRIVGLSSTTMLFGIATEVARHCRRVNPSIITVLGGPHATLAPEEALRVGFHVAVIGEGERPMLELVNGIETGDWENTPGIAYRKNGKVLSNPPAEIIEDLDDIPFPLRRPIDYARYPYFGFTTTRGCPYHCTFCYPLLPQIFGSRIRKRSVPNVLDEIETLQSINRHKSLHMKDDLFTIHTAGWLEAFRDGLRARGLSISYSCTSRVNMINEEKVRLLKETGCTSISFGVESGSQKILDFYEKGTTVKQVEQAFELCRKHDMHTHAFLMIGAPVEDREDLEQTYRLVKRIRPHSWLLYITTPFPGTKLYEYGMQRGIIKAKTYEETDNALNCRNLVMPMDLDHLGIEDLREYRNKINNFMVRHILLSRMGSLFLHPRKHFRKLVTQPREVLHFLGKVLDRYSGPMNKT